MENTLVKIDIEGSEYDLFATIPDNLLCKIKQLVIEIHHPFQPYKWSLLERLTKN